MQHDWRQLWTAAALIKRVIISQCSRGAQADPAAVLAYPGLTDNPNLVLQACRDIRQGWNRPWPHMPRPPGAVCAFTAQSCSSSRKQAL